MQRSNFITPSILISLAAHGLCVGALWLAFERTVTMNVTENGTTEIAGMSWEIEAPAPAPAPVVQPAAAAKPEVADTAPVPATHESAPAPAAQAASGKAGPPATEIQKYLLQIRTHLSEAIQIASIPSASAASLILKVSINKSGEVTRQQIEKSSGNPETDAKVLAAFQSILPLPPFPNAWKDREAAPQVLNVRLPIEIHSH